MKRYAFPKLPVLDDSQYVADYSKPLFYEVGEHMCVIPRMPPLSMFMNNTRRTDLQKFAYTEIPTGLKSSREEERVVRREYHRRYHGVWWMIKGQPFYMTGRAYHFFNYWRTTEMKRPVFRFEAMQWYWLWDDVYMDMDCMGLLDIKCRRLGDTEKGLHVAYEEMTRFRNTVVGMQHMKKDDAQKNYMRLVQGHKYMQYFFRPVSRGTTAPQKKLELLYPSQSITANNAKENDLFELEHSIPSLGSSVDYEATEVRAYDGQKLGFYFGDEYGKINPVQMHQYEQWGIIKRCLTLNNDMDIVGKAYLPTTVEDVANGESVKMMQKFWDQSDPGNLVNGRTLNGLRRVFRGYQLAAQIDEYGFHQVAEATKWRDAQIQAMIDQGDFQGVIELQRKQPRDVHEALQIAASDCTLNPHLLDMQIMDLKKNPPLVQRGDLEWTNGFGSDVEFRANPKGRWLISQMPIAQNKKMATDNGPGPAMAHVYAIGGDPIDSKAKIGSRGALAVYRKYNIADEKRMQLDIHGNPVNVEDMVTDQFVCAYQHRPDDPYDYFNDAAKTAVFYSAPIFFELQKPYVVNKFRDSGMKAYLARRPAETVTNARDKRSAASQEGAAATGQIISLYVDHLKNHISRRWRTYKLLEQLEDFRRFNTENRGERDLTVASGYALLSGADSRMQKDVEEMKNRWTELPWSSVRQTA